MGINDNHEQNDNGSEINCPHAHVTFSQNIRVGEEVNIEQLRGAKFSELDSINGVSNTQTGIMGMEITGLETVALHALNSALINVPINYEQRQTHADQSISIQQPREESFVLGRPGQSREAATNATWKRIQRP